MQIWRLTPADLLLGSMEWNADWAPVREPRAFAAWKAILRPIATSLRDEARPLAEQAVSRAMAMVPSAFGDAALAEQVRSNTGAALLTLANTIERGTDPTLTELPADVLVETILGHTLEENTLNLRVALALLPTIRGNDNH